jgi:hypothetical protein
VSFAGEEDLFVAHDPEFKRLARAAAELLYERARLIGVRDSQQYREVKAKYAEAARARNVREHALRESFRQRRREQLLGEVPVR